MVYIILVVWILLSAIFCFGRKLNVNVNKKLFLFLVFLIGSLIMGMRGVSVGVDTYAYKEKFDIITSMNILDVGSHFYVSSLEVGYALFMKICSLTVKNYFFFQMVYAFLFAILSAKFIYDNADNLFIVTIVFFGIGMYALSFNISRQMLAIILAANSWTYLRKGNSVKAGIFVVVASTIHVSALIVFAAFLLYALKNRKGIYKICVIVLILFTVYFEKLIALIYRLVPHYYNYFANEKGTQSAGLVWIIWIIVMIMAIRIIYKSQHITTDHSICAVFSLVWVVCNVIGLSINYFERVGYYFMPFVPILFSQFERYLRRGSIRKIYKIGVSVSFLLYFLISMLGSKQYVYTTFF